MALAVTLDLTVTVALAVFLLCDGLGSNGHSGCDGCSGYDGFSGAVMVSLAL